MSKTVAFLGLGVMGFPMAGHLASAGHTVRVYNRTASKTDKWCGAHSGQGFPTPKEAAEGAEIVFLCVGNDDDVRQVIVGDDGALQAVSAGAVIVDHTTTSATVARDMAEAAGAKGVGFVDAPVSGGQAGAENGVLTVMCGGAKEDFAKVQPAIDCFARAVRLMGPVGAGQLTKMVNQICIAGLLQGLAEGIQFAEKAGVDPRAVIDVISKGAAQSWQMENRFDTMIDRNFDFGFAVDWMRKDLGICLEEARNNGAQLPVTGLVDQFYADVQALGGNRWDTSSLIKRLDR